MKKIILIGVSFLLTLTLLTGCPGKSQGLQGQETVDSAGSTVLQEQPGVPLLDQGSATGETGNLLYIPNPHVESMACPEISLYGNGLLLYEHTVAGMLQMKRISLEDGCLLAEAAYAVTSSARVQIGNGFIGICDSGSGQVLILNDSLKLEATYSVPVEGDRWCLNQELETLYVFFADRGLLARDLATGETRWILDNVAFVKPSEPMSGYVLFSYTDSADQKTYNRCLNLSSGIMETIPADGFVSSGTRSGELWLLRQDITVGEYVLIYQSKAGTIERPEGMVELIPGRRQMLATDGSYRNFELYDLKGNFVSRCALPQIDYASAGTDLIWSGYWRGYFFRDTYDNAARLMFWDTGVPQEGENLPIVPAGTVQSPEAIMDQSIYQEVEELSQRFGLDIRIAEQCSLEYSHYVGDILKDPYFTREVLETLEAALQDYPEGFFHQLSYGSISQIRVELVINLRGKEEINTHPAEIGGFAQEHPDYYLIVLDGFGMQKETVYHEMSHVIDKRLEWDAMLRPDALFSEKAWLSLQPKGFQYIGSYVDTSGNMAKFENSGYFVSSYAMTFPTEDRATLMALVMSESGALGSQPGMAEKMRYYAACIRDCFDTEGWPEKTLWEKN